MRKSHHRRYQLILPCLRPWRRPWLPRSLCRWPRWRRCPCCRCRWPLPQRRQSCWRRRPAAGAGAAAPAAACAAPRAPCAGACAPRRALCRRLGSTRCCRTRTAAPRLRGRGMDGATVQELSVQSRGAQEEGCVMSQSSSGSRLPAPPFRPAAPATPGLTRAVVNIARKGQPATWTSNTLTLGRGSPAAGCAGREAQGQQGSRAAGSAPAGGAVGGHSLAHSFTPTKNNACLHSESRRAPGRGRRGRRWPASSRCRRAPPRQRAGAPPPPPPPAAHCSWGAPRGSCSPPRATGACCRGRWGRRGRRKWEGHGGTRQPTAAEAECKQLLPAAGSPASWGSPGVAADAPHPLGWRASQVFLLLALEPHLGPAAGGRAGEGEGALLLDHALVGRNRWQDTERGDGKAPDLQRHTAPTH